MPKMQWHKARAGNRFPEFKTNPLEQPVAPRHRVRVKQREHTEVPPPPFSGIGVSYVRVGGKIVDAALSADNDDTPDFVCHSTLEAALLIDDLRASLANDNNPVTL